VGVTLTGVGVLEVVVTGVVTVGVVVAVVGVALGVVVGVVVLVVEQPVTIRIIASDTTRGIINRFKPFLL
jgi:hypothetical protein